MMKKKTSARKNSPMKNSELNDLFAELKGEYLDTFPEKIEAIRNFWQAHNRDGLHNEFHKIKGTGTTYGIPEVTAIAEMLEELCENDSEKLGSAVMVSLELFHKVSQSYKFGQEYDLYKDPLYKAVKQIHDALEQAS